MSSNNCINNYVPEYVPTDLLWYEPDGLMTWYDQVKCEEFLRDSDKHFKMEKVINFDIIRREVSGEKVPDEVLKKYQTIQNERVSKYPKSDKKNFLAVLFALRSIISF